MKTKMTVTLGILFAGLFIAYSAFAEQGQHRDGDRRGYKNHNGECRGNGDRAGHRKNGKDGFRGLRMMQQLNLTADQQAKLEKITADRKKSAEPTRTEIKKLRQKMRAEWMKPKPSKADILALHKKINGLNNKLAEQRISSRLEMIAVLTPEQRTQMIEKMAQRGNKEAKGEGRGRGKDKGLNKHSRKNSPKSDPIRRNS